MNITENTAENTAEINLYDPAVQASMTEHEWHREAWKQEIKGVAYPGHEKWYGDPNFPGLDEVLVVQKLANWDDLDAGQQARVRELLCLPESVCEDVVSHFPMLAGSEQGSKLFAPPALSDIISPVRIRMPLNEAVQYIIEDVSDGKNVFHVAGKNGYMIEYGLDEYFGVIGYQGNYSLVHCCYLGGERPVHRYYLSRSAFATMFAYVAEMYAHVENVKPIDNIEKWAIYLSNWGMQSVDHALCAANAYHLTDELEEELGIERYQF